MKGRRRALGVKYRASRRRTAGYVPPRAIRAALREIAAMQKETR